MLETRTGKGCKPECEVTILTKLSPKNHNLASNQARDQENNIFVHPYLL
jgi:hypothetical protein